MEYVSCPLCGADDAQLLFTAPDLVIGGTEVFGVVRCQACDLMYVNPRPNPQAILKHYPPHHYTSVANGKHRFAARLKKALLAREAAAMCRELPPQVDALEIGCSNGEFLAYLRDNFSWQVKGVDVDATSVEAARTRFNLDVFRGTLADAGLPSQSFDAVILKHSLEHLHEPLEGLREVNRLLRPHGKLFLWLPNAGSLEARLFRKYWSGFDVPRHLYAYSPHSLASMLRQADFAIERVEHSWRPNEWISSLRTIAQAHHAPDSLGSWLVPENPLLMLLFSVPSLLCSALRTSGRIKVLAEKGSGSHG